MKLYDLELSGNCYKVRLFCALNNIPLDIVPVDYLNGEHKREAFLGLNPLGQIPVLDDHGLILRDSQAILVYLAMKHALEDWWPQVAFEQAKVMQWLSFSGNEIARGPNDARLHDLFSVDVDVEKARGSAEEVLNVLDAALEPTGWLVGNAPTLADIACYPYIALAHQGGVSTTEFSAVVAWCRRLEVLDGYIAMSGIERA
ncbi:glutathione S-transferase family protein [Veronia pacifica]|uniref:Glutathione S-transferase n=1 Tax=Veronia pacifica TaxID=1080227 RepID=A0A1C3ESF3_9GAMM|nr:glutathione S-transferase family protein [Veronia pacifica]ODA36103.1 glutathione S-transferase [Veronia pacifica]